MSQISFLGEEINSNNSLNNYNNNTKGRIAAVVLTYNSDDDLPHCLSGLVAQRDVDLHIIVVDNASRLDLRHSMEKQFSTTITNGTILNIDDPLPLDKSHFFICNNRNDGYSAGNNIGARIASRLGCTSILIINPDVQIYDPFYIYSLHEIIAVNSKTAITCSAVTNLSGAHENPMTEPSFIEEFFWPLKMLFSKILTRRNSKPPLLIEPYKISKVSGSCFLIRTDFLQKIGFFDQSVFLYCEESILQAQVKAAGWHILMNPKIHAVHAHRSNSKGNQVSRFLIWAESRRKFHKIYGGYGILRQSALECSRQLTLAIIKSKILFARLRSKFIRSGDDR